MKKISKILSVLLAVLMTFSMFSIVGAAAGDTYTVAYKSNGGSGTMSNTTFTVDEAKALRTNSFTKRGYTFLGWSEDKTATAPTYTDGQSVTNLTEAGNTVTLYAIWRVNTYVVEFRANNGEGSMENQTFTYGEEKALSANTFTREDYTFLGWSKSKTASSATYEDQEVVENLTSYDGQTIVLYAVWKRNPITVTGIEISSNPAKTEYYVGDTFDATGLSVTVSKSNHTVETITTGFTVSTPDMSTTGEKEVTVTYEGFTATFTINVVEKPVYNYTFSVNVPEVTEVEHGASVVLSTKVEGTYPDGLYVIWKLSNGNFTSTLNADDSITVVAEGVGATTFTAELYDADGNKVDEATVELTALEEVEEPEEPGFFAKIIAFFKNIINAILGIFKKD